MKLSDKFPLGGIVGNQSNSILAINQESVIAAEKVLQIFRDDLSKKGFNCNFDNIIVTKFVPKELTNLDILEIKAKFDEFFNSDINFKK